MKIILLPFLLLIQTAFSSELKLKNSLELSFLTKCNTSNQQITLSFVGDILIHKALYQAVVSETKHFTQLWKKTEPLFLKADFSIGNLEGPAALGIDKTGRDKGDIGFVYDGEVYSGTDYIFNYHPRIFSDLKDSGFDLLTMANNHALDRFGIGIDKSIKAARVVGIPTVGTKSSDEPNSDFFKIINIKNIRVAFIGCTEFVNLSENVAQVLFCETDYMIKLIKDLSSRSDVDAVIVLPHWGVEYSTEPKEYQKEYGHNFLEAGATAVVGSHPHVLEPWEKYITKNGRETLIIYSLGNFVAGQSGLEKQTGTVAYIGLSKDKLNKAKIYGVAYTPTFRVGNSIMPIGKNDSQEVLNHVYEMYGHKARLEPNGNINETFCPDTYKSVLKNNGHTI